MYIYIYTLFYLYISISIYHLSCFSYKVSYKVSLLLVKKENLVIFLFWGGHTLICSGVRLGQALCSDGGHRDGWDWTQAGLLQDKILPHVLLLWPQLCYLFSLHFYFPSSLSFFKFVYFSFGATPNGAQSLVLFLYSLLTSVGLRGLCKVLGVEQFCCMQGKDLTHYTIFLTLLLPLSVSLK